MPPSITNEQYPHPQEENIDYGHKKINNTLMGDSFGSLLTWSTMQYPHCVDKPSLFLQYNTCTITSSKKCIAIFAYNCIVYLHRRPPLVHGTILICKYYINLLLHHPRLLQPHMIHQRQYQHSFIQKHWCFFVFHPTYKNCKDLICFSFKFHNRCSYHHDPIWSYYENLVHCLLSSLHIMIGPMYAILAWIWFHVFP
jgi:hypothetical protein